MQIKMKVAFKKVILSSLSALETSFWVLNDNAILN